MTARGDLIIYGCDQSGNQIFSYVFANKEQQQATQE